MAHASPEDGEKWKNMKIHFRLQVDKFVDNKIYGIVAVEPETSRSLIREFELLTDNSTETKFSAKFRTISAAGFSSHRHKQSATVAAIPMNKDWGAQIQSKSQTFFFLGYVFALSPGITFRESTAEHDSDSKAVMVIEWNHIGDHRAQRYIVNLDDKAIKYIHERCICDHMKIQVECMTRETKHELEIIAVLANGKETCRSDLIEFTVPKREPNSSNRVYTVITVSDEVMPPDLPIFMALGVNEKGERKPTTQEENRSETTENQVPSESESDESHSRVQQLLQTLEKRIEDQLARQQAPLCSYLPHETFLGMSHYFSCDITSVEQSVISIDNTSDQ